MKVTKNVDASGGLSEIRQENEECKNVIKS